MLHPSWGERGHAAHSMQATYTTLAFRFYMCSTIEPLDKKMYNKKNYFFAGAIRVAKKIETKLCRYVR